MPTVRSSGLLREIAISPCASGRFQQIGRFRREAVDLVKHESLLNPAYCYRIVPLDEPPSHVLRAGGETLEAARLVPESGQLTAVAVGICTLGPGLEQRTTTLFGERRVSLALALDKLGNELLFALSRRVEDLIVAAARKQHLTAAQAVMQRLTGADQIGVSVKQGQVLHPLKSMSMMLGIGVDLPPVRWSRCDDCPSASKCTMSGRIAAPVML
jgi:hypothetical protein